MIKIRSIAVLLGAFALAACEKNGVQDITGSLPASSIRFFNFAVNAPAVNFYANDTKLTAVLSTVGKELPTGVTYGGVGAGGYYSGVNPGTYQFAGKLADTAAKNVAVSKVTTTLEAGKKYSFFMSGFYDVPTRTADGFVVEDNYSASYDYSQAYVRFVNVISNAAPLTLYAKNRDTGVEVPVGGAVAYKTAGAFAPLPNGVYDLNVRLAGSTVNTITRASVSFAAGRIYTIGARGDITVTSTTATNRPFLDNTINR